MEDRMRILQREREESIRGEGNKEEEEEESV
jgi:hypothetical protein